MGLDRALGEHISLALQIVVLVENFQGAKQIVGAVIRKCQCVAATVDKAMLRREVVVEFIQLMLGLTDGFICYIPVHLLCNEFLHTVAQFHHAFDTLRGGSVQVRFHHAAVFPVVDIAIHHCVAVVLHIGVCRDGGVGALSVTKIGEFRFRVGAMDVLNGVVQQRTQFKVFIRLNREILLTVLCTLRSLPSENHFRVLKEIAVDGETVLILTKVYPVGFDLNGTITLLQEDDVGNNVRTGIRFESVVGQSNCTEQLCSLCDILSDFGGLLVHGIARGHEGDHAARSDLIQRFCKKVIVNGKTELVVGPVVHLILAKRHIADGKIVEIASVGGLKTRHGDVGLGIKLLCDTPCDVVQLHAVELAVLHGFGQTAEKVAHTHGRFQNVACLESHLFDGIIDCLDDHGACVVGIQCGASRRRILFGRQQPLQLSVFLAPVWLVRVKGIGKTAPANIARQHFLLFGERLTAGGFKLFEQLNGSNIDLIFGLCTAFAQVFICDAEVLCVSAGVLLKLLIGSLLGGSNVRELLPYTSDGNGNRTAAWRWRVNLRFVGAERLDDNIEGQIVLLAG